MFIIYALWQEFHRNDTALVSVQHMRRHMMSIYSIDGDVNFL
jgi:hypothetical protein